METSSHTSIEKTLILILGLVISIGIVTQPILRYQATMVISQIAQSSLSDRQDSGDKKRNGEPQVSVLEAVVLSTAQVCFSAQYYTTQQQTTPPKATTILIKYVTVKLPAKLIKVLFNILIAPNAP